MYNISICGYQNIFKRPWFLYHINIEIFWCKKKLIKDQNTLFCGIFYLDFLHQKQVWLFFWREKKIKKKLFCFKMLQVSVFTIKFWSIVSKRRVSEFVNLSTITNHSKTASLFRNWKFDPESIVSDIAEHKTLQ